MPCVHVYVSRFIFTLAGKRCQVHQQQRMTKCEIRIELFNCETENNTGANYRVDARHSDWMEFNSYAQLIVHANTLANRKFLDCTQNRFRKWNEFANACFFRRCSKLYKKNKYAKNKKWNGAKAKENGKNFGIMNVCTGEIGSLGSAIFGWIVCVCTCASIGQWIWSLSIHHWITDNCLLFGTRENMKKPNGSIRKK